MDKTKPMIRHCKNCKWGNFNGKTIYSYDSDIWCDVKYTRICNCYQRVDALFCRHYKPKEWKDEE